MNFSVRVSRIDTVADHPNADNLSVATIGDGIWIAVKHDDGQPRYRSGDLVVPLGAGAILPEWLLRRLDCWDDTAQRGTLAGKAGNRVKERGARGLRSLGLLYPVHIYDLLDCTIPPYRTRWEEFGAVSAPTTSVALLQTENGYGYLAVAEGDDVAAALGITGATS